MYIIGILLLFFSILKLFALLSITTDEIRETFSDIPISIIQAIACMILADILIGGICSLFILSW